MSKLSEKASEYLSREERLNVLSTSNKAGENNIAVFGSVMAVDDSTVMLMLGENTTCANLRENPRAALLVYVPGKGGLQAEGCRVYLRLRAMEDTGERFEQIKAGIRARVGDAADMLKHLAIFEVLKVRPIIDLGQEI
ncbi:pyridoxamine 5'-phosphate oxidase family protein [Desulfoglaeba alkanexedens]|uniref:Pyridoxamine 5'-phosphate oxidase family protein n=1 Tax=Desulfoglaeba alkanexedens ALDC TaxID=980445 RepID=A0A4P8L354_9BACT|nr:pyridoxamine 5'-phosphate oxidase family protein [Desulfoglaeba alkanexedens]QCQ22288.1 pyridoxamine 5'-phosphate oxidase family protein [Desulfoglaeba alkanexedens ALDC]